MESDKAVRGGRILRRPAVLEFSGLGNTQMKEKMARGEFPAPVKLSDSGRAVGWLESELIKWREARTRKRDAELRRRRADVRKPKRKLRRT